MPNEPKVIRKLRAILSADVKGYSLLMADDEAFTIKTLKEYRSIMSTLIQEHNGRVVDAPGDNLLADFSSVVDAVVCAVEIQKRLETENDKLENDKKLQYRIGVNIGDVVQDDDRIYGNGVNVAARIEGLADPGGVCISRNAYNHVKSKLSLGYEYIGEHSVKNIKDPIRVYKLLMADEDAGKLIGDVPKRVTKNWIWATALLAAVIIISVSIQIYRDFTKPEFELVSVEELSLPLPDKPSIAVLAFDNMTGDPSLEYFCDGISEEIITTLSMIGELFVIARNSSFSFKGSPVKIQQVSKELGVRYVLEGSVRKSDDRVRVTAQLIDAIKGQHVWADNYDRELENILEIQDDISMNVVSNLQIKLTEGEQRRYLTNQYPSYEIFKMSLQAANYIREGTKEGYIRYGELAQKIVDLAPESPIGYRRLGWYHQALADWNVSPQENYHKAMEFAQKALSIDENDAFSHSLMCDLYVTRREFEKSIASGERSVELQPNGSQVHLMLGNSLCRSERYDDGISHIKKSFRLNPFPHYFHYLSLGRCYWAKEQYEDALKELLMALERAPNNSSTHLTLAITYSLLDMEEEARNSARKAIELSPSLSVKIASNYWPYKTRDRLPIAIDAMRKAGFPE